jgi:hypothetical protein
MAVAASLALWSAASDEQLLRADIRGFPDGDHDGLTDNGELTLGTSPDEADSDLDGYSDCEELARHTSPLKNFWAPGPQGYSVGLGAYQLNGKLHISTALYAQSGTLQGVTFKLYSLISGNLLELPESVYTDNAVLNTLAAKVPGELLMTVDFPVSGSPLIRTGAMSLLATLQNGSAIIAADALNLSYSGGMMSEFVSSRDLCQGGNGAHPGGVYRPLGGGSVPNTWAPGKICHQTTDIVGVNGAMVTQEIVSAECQDGWDAYCDASSCSGSVGSTIQILDPGALIGG